jgi:hypothetical protein
MKAKVLIIGAISLFAVGAVCHHSGGDTKTCPLKSLMHSAKVEKVEAVK